MYNKYSKTAVFLAALLEIIIIITAITSVAANDWKIFKLSLITIVLLILPFLITHASNKKKLLLPPGFQLISLTFFFLALYFGEINDFYMKYLWWDLMLHVAFGCYMVIISLYLMKGTIKKEKDASQKRFVMFTAIFAFSISIALGTVWELFEFAGDYFLKMGMVKGGLEDTSSDLSVKMLASFITSAIYYYKN